MSKKEKPLTPKQHAFIRRYLKGEQIIDIARDLKIPRSNIYYWFKHQNFASVIVQRQADIEDSVTRLLVAETSNSIRSLAHERDNPDEHTSSITISASKALLSAFTSLRAYTYIERHQRDKKVEETEKEVEEKEETNEEKEVGDESEPCDTAFDEDFS